jgi:hypothetical protein
MTISVHSIGTAQGGTEKLGDLDAGRPQQHHQQGREDAENEGE